MATLTARSNAVTPGRRANDGEPASKASDEVLAPIEQQTGNATVTVSESKTLDAPQEGDPVGPINSKAPQGEAQGNTGPVQVSTKTGGKSESDPCSQSQTSAPTMQSNGTRATATRQQVSQMTVQEARAQGFLPRESKEALGDLIWWTLALVLVAVGVKIFDFLA